MARVSSVFPVVDLFGSPWEPMWIETKAFEAGKVAHLGAERPQTGVRSNSPLSLPVAAATWDLPHTELDLLPRAIHEDLMLQDEELLPTEPKAERVNSPAQEALEAKATMSSTLGCHVPALVRAAGRGDLAKVVSLLEQGENPNGRDDFCLTALHGAAKKGHKRIVTLLLLRGAEVNARASGLHGETPLHYACKYGHVDVARVLLTGGADVSAETQDGRTPLQCAREKGHAEIELVLARVGP